MKLQNQSRVDGIFEKAVSQRLNNQKRDCFGERNGHTKTISPHLRFKRTKSGSKESLRLERSSLI